MTMLVPGNSYGDSAIATSKLSLLVGKPATEMYSRIQGPNVNVSSGGAKIVRLSGGVSGASLICEKSTPYCYFKNLDGHVFTGPNTYETNHVTIIGDIARNLRKNIVGWTVSANGNSKIEWRGGDGGDSQCSYTISLSFDPATSRSEFAERYSLRACEGG